MPSQCNALLCKDDLKALPMALRFLLALSDLSVCFRLKVARIQGRPLLPFFASGSLQALESKRAPFFF